MRFTFLIFLCLFCACFHNTKPKLIIPNSQKDEIFNKFINPITDKYELPRLRETSLSGDDLEVRIWVSSYEIDGFILSRVSNKWSALALKEIDCNGYNYYPKNKVYETGKINLATPKSGWENLWQKLVETGIVDLPSSDYISMIDEGSYKLETNMNGIYQIRFYGMEDKSLEAGQMKKNGEIIADEFGLHNFKSGSLCIEK